MTGGNPTEAETVESSGPAPSKPVDDRLIDELVSRTGRDCMSGPAAGRRRSTGE
ncbi:hypothetical protein [Streptomyces sp. NPDC018972]|uniref:hypothetical protein n=1 Tax=Streptomyces sp. NPDC018972 TaxID=3365060 RepID=UPI0037A428C8